MASITSPSKLTSSLKITQYDFDPDATTATEIEWIDMKEYDSLLVSFFRTVGTSALTFSLVGNAESDGSGTDYTICTYSGDEPDAAGDYCFLEANTQQLNELAAGLRYITAVCTVATGTDEGVVTYVQGGAHQAKLNLTAASIA